MISVLWFYPNRLAVTTGVMALLRSQFVWWPFHPLGFVLGMQLDFGFRFPGGFLVAWIVKMIALRYGGSGMYEKLKPVFMGLVLGDLIMMGFNVVVTGIFALI